MAWRNFQLNKMTILSILVCLLQVRATLHIATMDDVRLTVERLNVEEIVQAVTDPSCGAVSIFLGLFKHFFIIKCEVIGPITLLHVCYYIP